MWAGGDGGGLQWVLRAPDVQPVAAVGAGHFIRKSYFNKIKFTGQISLY